MAPPRCLLAKGEMLPPWLYPRFLHNSDLLGALSAARRLCPFGLRARNRVRR